MLVITGTLGGCPFSFLPLPKIFSLSPALSGLISSLEKAKIHLDSDEEDFGFLADLLKSRELQALVNVHNKVRFKVCVCVGGANGVEKKEDKRRKKMTLPSP